MASNEARLAWVEPRKMSGATQHTCVMLGTGPISSFNDVIIRGRKAKKPTCVLREIQSPFHMGPESLLGFSHLLPHPHWPHSLHKQ